jgi:hypothetical protein
MLFTQVDTDDMSFIKALSKGIMTLSCPGSWLAGLALVVHRNDSCAEALSRSMACHWQQLSTVQLSAG